MATLAERLVDEAADAILAVDREGRIVLWNRAAERLFGFPATDAIGQSLSLIIPPKHRDRHWEGFHRVAATGHTKYGTQLLRVPALRKDGSQVSIAFTVSLLKSSDGAVEAMAAVIRDETGRWQEEKALRERLRRLEQELDQARAGSGEPGGQAAISGAADGQTAAGGRAGGRSAGGPQSRS